MKRVVLFFVILWLAVQVGIPVVGASSPTPEPAGTVPPTAAPADDGVVRMLFFYSPTCPHCHEIITEFFPVLEEKYSGRLEVAAINVQDPASYRLLIAIEEQANLPEGQRGGVPTIVIGRYILVGSIAIRERLEGLIDEYLSQGGVDYPIPEEYLQKVTPTPVGPAELTPATTPLPSPTPEATAGPKPIALAYFDKVGCAECDRVTYDLNYLQSVYPQLQPEVFDIEEHAALNEWLCSQYGVPQQLRLTTPMVFVGDDYLAGNQVTLKNLEALVQKYADTGAEALWQDWDPEEQEQARSQIIERFRSMGVLAVALAALVDGLNPCAFATLILFVSYLALTGRQGREVLLVGLAFTLGVFITYLLVGVGLLKFLAALPFLKTLGQWIYGITAVLCLVLAAVSLNDYFKARRGQAEEMALRLPLRLRRWINRIVRQSMGSGAFAATAFVTGFLVSLIELACTGQVYLPTILFVLGVPEMQAQAFAYLLLYNLIFVLPLVVVFLLVYFGTTSEKLSVFLHRHTATIKLATAGLFLILSAGLVLYAV